MEEGFKVCSNKECEFGGKPQSLDSFYPKRGRRDSMCKSCVLKRKSKRAKENAKYKKLSKAGNSKRRTSIFYVSDIHIEEIDKDNFKSESIVTSLEDFLQETFEDNVNEPKSKKENR